jgi:hypothetical protein
MAPRVEQVVHEPLDVGRSFDENGQVVGLAAVLCVVAGMGDGYDHKPGVCQSLSSVAMAEETASATWEMTISGSFVPTTDRAVLGRRDCERPEMQNRRGDRAGIPDGAGKGRQRTVRRHHPRLDAGRGGGRHQKHQPQGN